MLSPAGPLWGVLIATMLVALIVLNVVRLRRSSTRPLPLVAAGVVVVLVLAGVGVLVALGST